MLNLENLTEIKNSLERINSRFEQTEERFSKLAVRSAEIIHSMEQKAKRMKKYEQILKDLWDTIKCANTHIW